MHALVRAALAVTALSALTQAAYWTRAPDEAAARSDAPADPGAPLGSPCPPGTLPDQNVCVPVPRPVATATGPSRGGPAQGQIPRRPDRPAEFGRYQWPVPLLAAGVIAREGSGLGLEQAAGTEVRAVALQNQDGVARVSFVGDLGGLTVITRHAVDEAQQRRTYLVVHGGLAQATVQLGQELTAGAVLGVLGQAGPAPGSGQGRLDLDVRQVRAGVGADGLSPLQMIDAAYTVPTDPRNVLPTAE